TTTFEHQTETSRPHSWPKLSSLKLQINISSERSIRKPHQFPAIAVQSAMPRPLNVLYKAAALQLLVAHLSDAYKRKRLRLRAYFDLGPVDSSARAPASMPVSE